jgi:hypothetical protein
MIGGATLLGELTRIGPMGIMDLCRLWHITPIIICHISPIAPIREQRRSCISAFKLSLRSRRSSLAFSPPPLQLCRKLYLSVLNHSA